MSVRNNKKIMFSLLVVLLAGIFLFWTKNVSVAQTVPDLGLSQVSSTLGLPDTDIRITIARIVRIALGLLGIVALCLMIYAGFVWMTAAGNEDRIAEAKKILINATIGLIIILSAYAIVSFVMSKLVEATTGSVVPTHCSNGQFDQGTEDWNDGKGDCGKECPACPVTNGGCPWCTNNFLVDSLPAGGDMCVRNVQLQIVFTKPVSTSTLSGEIVVTKKGETAEIGGEWQAVPGTNSYAAKFVPKGDCGDGKNNVCLASSTEYTLSFKNKGAGIKSLDNNSLSCNMTCNDKKGCCGAVDFKTGEGIDFSGPAIKIISPVTGAGLGQNSTQKIKVGYVDDTGVKNLLLFVDGYLVKSQPIAGCVRSGEYEFTWSTNNVKIGDHNLKTNDYDGAGNVGEDAIVVKILPEHCFNEAKDADETGLDCGGSECLVCEGSKCIKDEECASGYCEIKTGETEGVCVDKTQITDFSPFSGAPQTLVTISGKYFGENPGHVYFSKVTNPTIPADITTNQNPVLKDWVEAKIPECGKAFSNWSNSQIVVEVTSTAVSGPIMVLTAPIKGVDGQTRTFFDVTNKDNWGLERNFLVNDLVRPGLCGVDPASAKPGEKVNIYGKNLGTLDKGVDKDFVSFGNVKTITLQTDWTNTLIRSTVPVLDTGDVALKITNDGVESNSIKFIVKSGVSETSPIIDSITPSTGGKGQYISILGKNFGKEVGRIMFKEMGVGGAINTSEEVLQFPKDCDSVWTDNKIIAKFPKDKGVVGKWYTLQITNSNNETSVLNKNINFTVDGNLAAPGICKIDPISSPVPMFPGTHLKIYGEYFTTSTEDKTTPDVLFWHEGADPISAFGRMGAESVVRVGENELSVRPRVGTISGDVVVVRQGSSEKISNPLKFSVSDCNVVGCTTGYKCCKDTATCIKNTSVCSGETRSTGYVWRFATKDIPSVPHVVERCDSGTDEGKNMPSPAPSVQWGAGVNSDQVNVCRTALINVEFSLKMNSATINKNNILIRSCEEVNEKGECQKPLVENLTDSSYILKNATESSDYLSLQTVDPNKQWKTNTWYQVVLTTNIKSAGVGTESANLATDKPCVGVPNSAYCFYFKTGAEDCRFVRPIITPSSYWTNVLEAPMRSHSASEAHDVYYNGYGLSSQHCILMDVSNFEWQWETGSKNFADIYGAKAGSKDIQVSALGNTVNIGLKNPADAVNVVATVTDKNNPTKIYPQAFSPLTIDLSNPEVVDYWPKCLEACPNAEVAVKFNTTMSNKNLSSAATTGAVQLRKCSDVNCLSYTVVTENSDIILDKNSNYTILKIANSQSGSLLLNTSTYYQVVISASSTDISKDIKQLWSAAKYGDPTKTSKPYDKIFTWRFRTKKDKCLISKVSVEPKEYYAVSLTDRVVYSASAESSPDACSAVGQKINVWDFDWSWNSSDLNVATVQNFVTKGHNPYCTADCLRKGSDIPAGANALVPLCGNDKIEAGEDCDSPNKNKGCSLNCLFTGNTSSTICSNGIVDQKQGEACDPKDQKSAWGCSAVCRHTGSSATPPATDTGASVCGDGLVTSGEDCDLGIVGEMGVSASAQGCTENCLHQGTQTASSWCGLHLNDFSSLGFSADEFNLACKNSSSQCGDGILSPDEDEGCDGAEGWDKNNCNAYCLKKNNNSTQDVISGGENDCTKKPLPEGCSVDTKKHLGSSLLYSSPSNCGDGIVGFGEDATCETGFFGTPHILKNPWVLAIGIGKGESKGIPPTQTATITGATTQPAGNKIIGDSGKFIIACGYKTDEECQNKFGEDTGVGSDSCCYSKPHLTAVYPGSTSTPVIQNVCPNTYLEAKFDRVIDRNTLAGNYIIARGLTSAEASVSTAKFVGVVSADANTKISDPRAFKVNNNIAYVASAGDDALEIIDLSNSSNPTHLSSVQGIDAVDVALFGNYAFVANFSGGGFDIIDISNPKQPILKKQIGDPEGKLKYPSTLVVKDGYLYIGFFDANALVIADIKDPLNPVMEKFVFDSVTPDNAFPKMAIDGNLMAVIKNSKLYVLDIADKKLPKILSVSTGVGTASFSNVNDLFLGGDTVVIMRNGLIAAVKISGSNLSFVQDKILLGGQSFVFPDKSNTFIGGTISNGLFAYQVKDDNTAEEVGHLSAVGSAVDLQGIVDLEYANGFIYAITNKSKLTVVDAKKFFESSPVCSSAEDVTSLIAGGVANANDVPWYKKVWNFIAGFINNIFGSSVIAVGDPVYKWCAGNDLATAEVFYDTSSTTRVLFKLSESLAVNKDYAIILKEGIKDDRGVSLGKRSDGKNFNWRFATASDICQINSLMVEPEQYYFYRAGATTTLRAVATSASGQELQPVPGYVWNFFWGPKNNTFVSVEDTASSTNIITANFNGELDVSAAVNVTDNSANPIKLDKGLIATAKSHIIVYMCDNPWPPKNPFGIFPYADEINNKSGFNLVKNIFDYSAIPAASGSNGYFNFNTYYCADNGGFGTFDDLPYLRAAVQTSSSIFESDSGSCSLTNTTCTQNSNCEFSFKIKSANVVATNNTFVDANPNTKICYRSKNGTMYESYFSLDGEPQKCSDYEDCLDAKNSDPTFKNWAEEAGVVEMKCSALGLIPEQLSCNKPVKAFKRFIFTNEQNSDAIGIQIFPNPQHLTAQQWFENDKKSGGQNFSANLQSLTINGYPAVADENKNNIYVDALNISDQINKNIYTNIYLFSVNSDAKASTRQVFEQMIKNLNFNTNLTNYGYCGLDIDNPKYEVNCKTDLDCPTGEVCSVQVDKLKRNYTRLRHLSDLNKYLDNFGLKTMPPTYPALKEGSYLPGQSLSVWDSSWALLGSTLGVAGLPKDPINRLGPAGTCASSTKIFCLADTSCPAGETCVLHDQTTGWSDVNKRSSFACNQNSLAYRYNISSSTGYFVRAQLENPGFVPGNLNLFISDFIDANHFSVNNGVCNGEQEIYALGNGACGDGVINYGKGEVCEPPAKIYDESGCNSSAHTRTVKTCSPINCQWGAAVTESCIDITKCGNHIIDSGEVCDDGKSLNGTYGHCSSDCQTKYGAAGTCGDTKKDAAEFCDKKDVALANYTGWCKGGVNNTFPCNQDSDCNTLFTLTSVNGYCDKSGIGSVDNTGYKYGFLDKAKSCSSNCFAYGPYCGDGIVQPEYGEECETDQSCFIDGKEGVKKCKNCQKVNDRGVAFWNFDAPKEYSAGPAYLDEVASLKAACGVIKNSVCPIKTTGKDGNGLQFSDSVLDINVTNEFFGQNFSLSFWFNPINSAANSKILLKYDPNLVAKSDFYVGFDKLGEGKIEVGMPKTVNGVKTDYYIRTDEAVSLNVWHQVFVTYANGTVSLYLDGIKQTQVETGVDALYKRLPTSPDHILAGADAEWSNGVLNFLRGRYYRGGFDSLNLFNRTLSENEIKEMFSNNWTCSASATTASTENSTAELCGNGKVDAGEACDIGVNKEFSTCAPAYNSSCEYCALDCKNKVAVSKKEYCGDGVLNGNEKCEMGVGLNNGKILVPTSQVVAGKFGEYEVSPLSSSAAIIKPCNQVLNENINKTSVVYDWAAKGYLFTHKKGQITCESCSAVKGKCIACGIEEPDDGDSENSSIVSGEILNVLNPHSDSPLVLNDVKAKDAGSLDLYYVSSNNESLSSLNTPYPSSTAPSRWQYMVAYESDFWALSNPNHFVLYPADYTWGNGATVKKANIINNPICSTIDGEHYQLVFNDDRAAKHRWDFPITSGVSSYQYNLFLSPVIQNTKHLRLVVSWKNFDGAKYLTTGFFSPLFPKNIYREQTAFSKAVGIDYAGSETALGGVWYHDINQLPNIGKGAGVTAYTIDVNTAMNYAFYVRIASSSLEKLSDLRQETNPKIQVDMYLYDGDTAIRHFSKPIKTIYLDSTSLSSLNSDADKWHVLNVVRGDGNASLEDNIQIINRIRTDLQMSYTE